MNIIITGASSGIGFDTALHFLMTTNYKVLAIARNKSKLQLLENEAQKVGKSAQLSTLAFDLVQGNYQQELIPYIKECMGEVDILINNAGQLINKPFVETEDADWQQMWEANVMSAVKMVRALLPLMMSNNSDSVAKKRHIVNISSMGGFQGTSKFNGLAAYSVSKAALICLTECLAEELSAFNIAVNALALGSVQTEMIEKAFPGYEANANSKDVAAYIAHFALYGSALFNGKIIPMALHTP